ncbi:amino acid permease [Thiotrichales bacterium 19S3-7]|nr:amino acid permease [Thiotrichales bacterium 19S3-7]MCF6801194.1 amino acid permease [Thiotrichales bacterium 19S3-11]
MSTAKIGLFMLAMLMAGAIDNIRNLPTTALFGTYLPFFFVFAALFFFIPVALVSAELASSYTNKGQVGIYGWVHEAFGEKIALLAIWFQWINTVFWFPTVLSYLAANIAYLISPELINFKLYLIATMLILFWIITIVNLKGLRLSAEIASFCTIIGVVIPMSLIIILAIIYIAMGNPSELHFTLQNTIPFNNGSTRQQLLTLTAIITSFLGLELATVHVRSVRNPKKTVPRALFFAMIFVLLTMGLGSLSIAMVVPKHQLNLVAGVFQSFQNFLNHFQIGFLLPVLVIMILIGSFGTMINWIISPARGIMHAAEDGFLPLFFQKRNKANAPSRILITQAILVSIISLAYLLMPSVNGSYWLLTDLSTQIYVLMYFLMFLAAIKLHYKHKKIEHPFCIPGGSIGMWIITIMGLLGTLTTLAVGFIPPESINVGSKVHYEIIFISGLIIAILPVSILYFYKSLAYRPAKF